MKLGISLTPRLQQAQRLSPRLSQNLEEKISLAQHINRENRILPALEYANDNQTWREFDKDDFSFVYAAVPYEVVSSIVDEAGVAFAHCWYNPVDAKIFGKKFALARGEWSLFAVYDRIPEELLDPVILHERGEMLSLADHSFATEAEWAYARKRRKLTKMINWLRKEHPSKFVDIAEGTGWVSLPNELLEIVKNHRPGNEEEYERMQWLIDEFPLTKRLVSLASEYQTRAEKFLGEVKKIASLSVSVSHSLTVAGAPAIDAADILSDSFAVPLRKVRRDKLLLVPRAILNNHWIRYMDNSLHYVRQRYIEPFSFEHDFHLAYEKAVAGERIVTSQDIGLSKLAKSSDDSFSYAGNGATSVSVPH